MCLSFAFIPYFIEIIMSKKYCQKWGFRENDIKGDGSYYWGGWGGAGV